MADTNKTRSTAARAFVRSLNILLKFARMYDFGHPRTSKQYEIAWLELRTALGSDDQIGLLLAVSGDQLLLDGNALESSAVEKSFARLLSAAGIASIHFAPTVTHGSLARFVRAFPTGHGSKAKQLAKQLKEALDGDPHIHVNEVCFVPADSAVAKSTMAAQLAARTLGMNSEQTDQLLNDPEKLLQLLVAAEGGQKGGSDAGQGGGHGSGSGGGYGGGQGSGHGSGGGGGSATGNDRGTEFVGAGSQGQGADAGSGGDWIPRFYTGMPSDFVSTSETGASEIPNSGPGFEGPVTVVSGKRRSREPRSGEGWNIVGGTAGGTPLAPDVAGFWLHKDDSAPPSPTHATGPVTAVYGSGGVESGSDFGGSAGGGQLPGRWRGDSPAKGRGRPQHVGPGSVIVDAGLMSLQEDELQGILKVLGQIGRTMDGPNDKIDPNSFQLRLSTLPRRARFTVGHALSAIAAQAPSESADKPTLLKLAEHIAIRFALQRYQRGDIQVDAVRQMLNESTVELESLRRILGLYEEKMTDAGIPVKSQMELMAQEFWSLVPEEKKKEALESKDAWCVPAIRVREYTESMIAGGEAAAAEKILSNYANCLSSPNPEARRQIAMGLTELAPVYAARDVKLFTDTIREAGLRVAEEKDSELRSLISAAFVRLSQEAANKRCYPAIQRSVEMLDYIDGERVGTGKSLRPRISVENHLPEFIEEAIKEGNVESGLRDLLRRIPGPAAEQIATRFGRVGFREDGDLLVSMISALGPEAIDHLRTRFRQASQSEALDTVGILTRVDFETVEAVLPERIREWKRGAHDRIVRQIASSGSTERGRLLLRLFDGLDAMVRPLAVDEIGMSGEVSADMLLLRLAEGDLPKGSTQFLRLKAIEALGRLRLPGSETVLRKIAEARKTWRWANPSELRLVAAQSMERIDPEWMRAFISESGFSMAELAIELLDNDPSSSAIRQRRYPRLRMESAVAATTTNLRENFSMNIPEMGLGGGIALCEQNLHPGTLMELKMNAGQKAVKAHAVVRDANTQARAFEVVDMDLEERAKLRRLLIQLGRTQKENTPQERSRRGSRTILRSGS